MFGGSALQESPRMGLPVFVEEAPEYEARGEVMFVRWRDHEIVLPINVCIAAVGRCRRELAAWERRNAEVVPFPGHAASS